MLTLQTGPFGWIKRKLSHNQNSSVGLRQLHHKMSKKIKFAIGDKVWAFDNSKWYHAKVLKIQSMGQICKYFIHYDKWDRKYDTWLDEASLNPFNDGQYPVISSTENKKAKQVDSAASTTKSTRSSSSVSEYAAPVSSSSKSRKTQVNVISDKAIVQDEDEASFRYKFSISVDLKRHLVDEWQMITQETPNRLLRLPQEKDCSVRAIIHRFIQEKETKLDKKEVRIKRNSYFFV